MPKAAIPDPGRGPDQLAETLRQMALQPHLTNNLQALKDIFADCSDLVIHEVAPRKGPRGCLLYIAGLVRTSQVDRDILAPLVSGETTTDLEKLAAGLTALGDVHVLTSVGEVVERMLSGGTVLLIDGAAAALGYAVQGWQSRAVQEPVSESSIRGPRESFVETVGYNTAMLRRKICSPALKMVSLKIGRITQTEVVVSFVQGLANPEVVKEVFTRLGRIDIDGVLEGGYLEEFIEDSPFSLFPQVQNTERPDTVAANLLEGRVAILVDGTPSVLIVPVVFGQFMQASDDYYERFLVSSAIRFLRYVFLAVALLLPSLWIAVISFHQETFPASLLLTIVASREGIPFPALIEALIMEVTFEVLREAGIRLPRPVGTAVSIVGALVIGEAAVRAGLASAPMVIIVSITGISSFAIPRYSAGMAIRMLRFPLMLMASSLGMFGLMAGLSGIMIHLCSLKSFGVPYLSPVAPANSEGLKDSLVRGPRWWTRYRPRLRGRANPVRVGGGPQPEPPQSREEG